MVVQTSRQPSADAMCVCLAAEPRCTHRSLLALHAFASRSRAASRSPCTFLCSQHSWQKGRCNLRLLLKAASRRPVPIARVDSRCTPSRRRTSRAAHTRVAPRTSSSAVSTPGREEGRACVARWTASGSGRRLWRLGRREPLDESAALSTRHDRAIAATPRARHKDRCARLRADPPPTAVSAAKAASRRRPMPARLDSRRKPSRRTAEPSPLCSIF